MAGPYQFTHAASHQAWYAAVNALFGRFKRFKVDYSVIPWATFTDPEVARVGLSEAEARERAIPFEVTRYGIEDLDRAIADGSRIPIEERPGEEVVGYRGVRWAPEGIAIRNPAFDVTPAGLITAIVTEKGVVHRPDAAGVAKLFS